MHATELELLKVMGTMKSPPWPSRRGQIYLVMTVPFLSTMMMSLKVF
jgi:hypothetical protein